MLSLLMKALSYGERLSLFIFKTVGFETFFYCEINLKRYNVRGIL